MQNQLGDKLAATARAAKSSKLWDVSHAVLLVTIVAVVAWILMTINVLNNNYKLQRQVDNAKLDNQITELENENLKLEQMYYQTDEYLELSSRSLLGKALPGENVVILPRIEHTETGSSDGKATTSKSNLDQWLDFLFGQHK
ncbi:MAG: hypothetical protein Q4C83_02440 [Candidatus Saccharibacteria bacterium]|nr:hypothetical protein [Candidatus Saccharibacteria bacterium]